MAAPFTCPCCGHRTLSEQDAYEVCPVCLWEDDGVSTSHPTVWGEGPNGISLAEGQARYRRHGRSHSDSPPGFCARPPRADEPQDPSWTPFGGHDDPVSLDLTSPERLFLVRTLRAEQGLAVATGVDALLGAASAEAFTADVVRIAGVLSQQQPLSRRDWTRALALVELLWASTVFGHGPESPTHVGLPDERALRTLRSIQLKVRQGGALLGAAGLRDLVG